MTCASRLRCFLGTKGPSRLSSSTRFLFTEGRDHFACSLQAALTLWHDIAQRMATENVFFITPTEKQDEEVITPTETQEGVTTPTEKQEGVVVEISRTVS